MSNIFLSVIDLQWMISSGLNRWTMKYFQHINGKALGASYSKILEFLLVPLIQYVVKKHEDDHFFSVKVSTDFPEFSKILCSFVTKGVIFLF